MPAILAHAVPSRSLQAALLAAVLVLIGPGAGALAQSPQGFGEQTTGGAGYPIVWVTTLEDYGATEPVIPGSLRHALTGSNRVIQFTVGGEINLRRRLDLHNQVNVTIDGSTAPHPGITLRLNQLEIKNSSNIIVRHIRSRDSADGGANLPGFMIWKDCERIWLDHLSISRASDESIGVYGGSLGEGRPRNVTLSWNLIADAHDPASANSGKGMLISGSGSGGPGTPIRGEFADRVTVHHNIFTNNHQRNPQISGNSDTGIDEPLVDLRNNVVHDWYHYGTRIRYSGAGNVVGNIYRSSVNADDALVLIGAGPVFTSGNDAPPQGPGGVDLDSLGTSAAPLPVPAITEHPLQDLPSVLIGDGVIAGVGALPRDDYDQAVIASVALDLGGYLETCSQIGGTGCAIGEPCTGGSFWPSSDFGSLCCLGGTCGAPGPGPDADGDGVEDALDNCPDRGNPGQEDADSDGAGDVCDNCPLTPNPDQDDSDGDGAGDFCDPCPASPDADADGVCDDVDNCPSDHNPGQEDADGDGIGDACDGCGTADADLDGICDALDNCPDVDNPGQENTDGDAEGGDACDITVISPLDGDVTCEDPPPTITWTPEVYDRFRVIIATNRRFNKKVTSGKTLLTDTSWTVGPRKWSRICARTRARLHIMVLGQIAGTTIQEYSTPNVITVK